MSDLFIRTDGKAARITLSRPKALNALTHDMVLEIESALRRWQDDPNIALILIDAEGDRAFCAGGDISLLYERGLQKDYAYGQQFWRDEYRLNAAIATYPKPIVSFLQGFTMGGGVGLGCHASHRIVCDSSRIAMPECSIGLLPDVGGSYLLAKAPGHLGTYLGLSGAKMDAADAIYAGFADLYVPFDKWEALKQQLSALADIATISALASPPPPSPMQIAQAEIDQCFSAQTLPDIFSALASSTHALCQKAYRAMQKNDPLAMVCALRILKAAHPPQSVPEALEQEYRFVHRAMQHSDFLEGIRAAIIDRDGAPQWTHTAQRLPQPAIDFMLGDLGEDALDLTGG